MAKNPIKGKVKTRLSVDLGDEATLLLYKKLMSVTRQITTNLDVDKHIFYSDFIDLEDDWESSDYKKHLQIQNKDLGLKMKSAFQTTLKNNISKCVIIGTDCPYITQDIINSAFYKLNDYDAVIGPAVDGGFYLLGVKSIDTLLFDDITWSSNKVLNQLIKNLNKQNLKHYLLQELEDIDDLQCYNRYLNSTKLYE